MTAPAPHVHVFVPDLTTLSDSRGHRCREVCYCGRDRWVDVAPLERASLKEMRHTWMTPSSQRYRKDYRRRQESIAS